MAGETTQPATKTGGKKTDTHTHNHRPIVVQRLLGEHGSQMEEKKEEFYPGGRETITWKVERGQSLVVFISS